MDKLSPIKRWQVLKRLVEGNVSLKDAGKLMGVSYRQAIRLKNAMLKNGVRGLIHGNIGKKPSNLISNRIKNSILQLSQKDGCRSMNDTHFCEHLRVHEGIEVSRETVRKIRRNAGIEPVYQRRSSPVKYPCNPQEGATVIWHCMEHEWILSPASSCCLIAAIDHYTGKCLAARFSPHESSEAYLWVLREIIRRYGVPSTIIQDCNNLLKRTDNYWSLQEELSGEQSPTQVGFALKMLGINALNADTKRKKRILGKIFEEFYVSLAEETESGKIRSLCQGNTFLNSQYIQLFNSLYAIKATTLEKKWRVLHNAEDIDRICSLRYEATMGKDNSVALGDITISIPRTWHTILYGRTPLEVRQLLDGTWRVYFQIRLLLNTRQHRLPSRSELKIMTKEK